MAKFSRRDKVVVIDTVFPRYLNTDAEVLMEEGLWSGVYWYRIQYWDGSDGSVPEQALASYSEFYSVVKREPKKEGCSCGAKHTSRPDWHYDYCEESKKDKELDNIWDLFD